MTGPTFDLDRVMWPGEETVAVAPGRSLGAAALRLAGLSADRSAVPTAQRLALVATSDRFLAVLTAPARSAEVAWQVQLPRLSVDLHRLPGQLVVHAAGRFVAVEIDDHSTVGPLLAALPG